MSDDPTQRMQQPPGQQPPVTPPTYGLNNPYGPASPYPPLPPIPQQVPRTLSRRKLLGCAGLAVGAGMAFAVGFVLGNFLTHQPPASVQIIATPEPLASVQIIATPGSLPTLSDAQRANLSDELRHNFGLPVSLSVDKTYLESVQGFGNGMFNVFYASDYAYVIAKAKYNALPILRRQNPSSDDPYYYSYILTKASSNISTLIDLKGKTLSYVDQHSTSGYLFPRYAMFQKGLNENDVHTTYAGGQDKSLESIFNGGADACAVASLYYKSQDGSHQSPIYEAFLKKYGVDDSSIVPIYKSDPLSMPPIAVHPDISDNDKWRLQAGFLLLQDSTILQELGIAGFGPVTDQDYEPIRTVAHTLGIDLQNL